MGFNNCISIKKYIFFLVGFLFLFGKVEAHATNLSEKDPLTHHFDQQTSFSFMVWGHPKTSDGKKPLHFEEILATVVDWSPNFLVITGDAINGMWGKQVDPDIIITDWERFDDGVTKLGIPVYRVPGNHDVHNFITRDIYYQRYQKVPFAITFRDSRFIFFGHYRDRAT